MEMKTVEDAWGLYSMAILASLKKKSQVTERGRWDKYISPVLGEKNICDLTTFDYLMLKRSLEAKALSPQSVHHCLSLLRRVLNKAEEWGKFNCTIPKFNGIMPKFDNKRIRYLTKDEMNKLLLSINSIDASGNWQDVVLFAVNTGIRKGELFDIRGHDVNIDGGFFTLMDTKSHKNRIIHMNKMALDIAIKKIKFEFSL